MSTIAQLICTTKNPNGVWEGWCVHTEKGELIGFVPPDYRGHRYPLHMPESEPPEGVTLTGYTGRKPLQLALEDIGESITSCTELPRIQVTPKAFRLAQKMGWAYPGIKTLKGDRICGVFPITWAEYDGVMPPTQDWCISSKPISVRKAKKLITSGKLCVVFGYAKGGFHYWIVKTAKSDLFVDKEEVF